MSKALKSMRRFVERVFSPRGARLREELKQYHTRLIDGARVSEKDSETAALVSLELSLSSEKRFRSLQVLKHQGSDYALAATLRELVSTEDLRFDVGESTNVRRLVGILRQLLPIQSQVRDGLQSMFLMASMGVRLDEVSLRRPVPVRIYLKTNELKSFYEIRDAVETFVEAIGLEIDDGLPSEQGSWFKRSFARTRDLATQDEVLARLMKAERALELATRHERESIVDKNHAEGAARLIEALEEVHDATCQIGSILLQKTTGPDGSSSVDLRTLSPAQMILLEQSPDLLRDNRDLTVALEQVDDTGKAASLGLEQ